MTSYLCFSELGFQIQENSLTFNGEEHGVISARRTTLVTTTLTMIMIMVMTMTMTI